MPYLDNTDFQFNSITMKSFSVRCNLYLRPFMDRYSFIVKQMRYNPLIKSMVMKMMEFVSKKLTIGTKVANGKLTFIYFAVLMLCIVMIVIVSSRHTINK